MFNKRMAVSICISNKMMAYICRSGKQRCEVLAGNIIFVLRYFGPTATSDLRQLYVGCKFYFVYQIVKVIADVGLVN